jgi:hypothetical protein
MVITKREYFRDVWAIDKDGRRVFPYKGQRGPKKGLFSVNFTNDTNKFEGVTEEQLIQAILDGRFRERGTIRMLPLVAGSGAERNAFAPKYFRENDIKNLA